MSETQELTLNRDVTATIIPAGEEHSLLAGTSAIVSQALGGTVTIRTDSGLFRLSSKDWDALGKEVAEELTAAQVEVEAQNSSERGAPFSEQAVWGAMKQCYDPEIPVNIVDLGLIYDMRIAKSDVDGKHSVQVKMTLTAQGCGMGPVIAKDAKNRIEALAPVSSATVDIVWDPPWTPHMISDEGRIKLGLD